MIVVDTSALVAILLGEPDAQSLSECLGKADRRLISAANYVELGTVLAGRGRADPLQVTRDLDQLLAVSGIETVAVTGELARAALAARIRYGKGFGAPAKLNFGDCFAYALARSHNAPLLFVGDDFPHTDIQPALVI